MSKKNDAKHAAKSKILKAAREAFSDRGYEAATLKVIGDLCDAKRTLIMYHFNSKEELWQQVILAVKNEHQAAFNRYYSEGAPKTDHDKAKQCGIAFLKASREVPEYGRILIREGLTASERLRWINEALTPEQIAMPVFDDPDYTEAAFLGLVRQIQAGSMLYLANMSPLMAVEGSAFGEYPVIPLSDEAIDKTVEYMLVLVELRLKEIKAARAIAC